MIEGRENEDEKEYILLPPSTEGLIEVDVYEELHPMRMLLAVLEAEKLISLVKGESGQIVSLRAPPALAA